MVADLDRRFGGVARLYGEQGAARLRAAHVCVIGIGGVGSWFGQGHVRRAARQSRREAARLKAEVERHRGGDGSDTLSIGGPKAA